MADAVARSARQVSVHLPQAEAIDSRLPCVHVTFGAALWKGGRPSPLFMSAVLDCSSA